MAEVKQENFIARMELFRGDSGNPLDIIAYIWLQGDNDARIVDVPPHMAGMLPQAIAMIANQENG